MKNKIDINSSINELNETSSFISRHIGSSDDQVNDCLGFLNYKSLDQLVMDTLPNQIVLDVDVDLKESMSEDEALKYLQSIYWLWAEHIFYIPLKGQLKMHLLSLYHLKAQM